MIKCKKIYLCIIIIAFTALLLGCWDYVEYEDMSQVYGVGIDYNPNTGETTVTIQCIESGKDGGGGNESSTGGGISGGSKSTMPKVTVHAVSALTIIDAMEKIQEGIDKRLFYGYLEVIVIGKDSAKYITKDIIETLDRTPTVRATANLFVSQEPAMDVIRSFDPYSKLPSAINIHNMANNLNETGETFPVSINEFLRMLSTNGLEPVLPIISLERFENIQVINDLKTVRPLSLIEGHCRIDSMAVFYGPEFRGVLDDEKNIGLGLILNNMGKTYINLNSSQMYNTKQTMVLRITSSKSKVEAKLVDNMPNINIKINVKAVLRKYVSEEGSSYITPDVITSLESRLEKSVCSQIEYALKKGQKEFKSDIFGFGNALYKKYPRLWHSKYENVWDSIFPNLPVNISINAKITNTGTNIMKIHEGK